MKKIISLLLALLVGCTGIYVCADTSSEFTSEFTHNREDDTYSVSGIISGNMGNVPMLLAVTDSNGGFVTGLQTYSFRKDGKVVYEFDKLSFPGDTPTDKYTICVSSEFFNSKQIFYISLLALETKWEVMNKSNSLIESDSGLCDYIVDYARYLGLNPAAFEFNDKNTVEVFDGFIKETYGIPSEFDSEDSDGIAQVQESWRKFSQDAYYALAASELVDIESSADTRSWIDTYYNALGLNLEDSSTPYSEDKINSYFNSVQASNEFSGRMASVKTAEDVGDIKSILNEITLLSAIDTMQYTAVSDILLSFGELFPIDKDLFDDLDSDELGDIFTDMAGKSYGSYELAAKDFEDLAEQYLSDDSSSGSGSSGGGSGGNRGSGGNISFGDDKKEAVSDNNNIMTDISEAEWAREAIESLTKKGIINGRGNGKFAPSDNITRAEFVKIVVSALGLDTTDKNSGFSDVSADAWYCTYVAAAKKAGIVTGNDKNQFNPDSFISRQDMALVLYRAYGFSAGGDGSVIPDYHLITDYAKEAVSALYSAGVINGMGDGTFAPHSNASRAQAAQMIYRIIK